MIYNLKTQKDQADQYYKKLRSEECTVEIIKKRNKRTNKQNRYLHLLFGYFGLEVGCSAEYVKRQFFKFTCNYDLFVVEVETKLGLIQELKSTKDLNTFEMTIAIDRFKDFSAREAGIVLPDAEDKEFLNQIHNMLEEYENKRYI